MYKDFIYTQSKLYKSFGPLSPNLRPERSLLNAIFLNQSIMLCLEPLVLQFRLIYGKDNATQRDQTLVLLCSLRLFLTDWRTCLSNVNVTSTDHPLACFSNFLFKCGFSIHHVTPINGCDIVRTILFLLIFCVPFKPTVIMIMRVPTFINSNRSHSPCLQFVQDLLEK